MRLSDSTHLMTTHGKFSRPLIMSATLVLVACVAVGDFVLVDIDAISHLYYLPILLAATQLGRGYAVGVAALAVVLTHLGDPELSRFHYGEADVMELILFLTVALVASRLSQNARELRRLACTDDLTGLHNLRSFESISRELIEQQRRTRGAIAILCLDVDRLKRLNDTYGHLTGADAVKCIGQIIAEQLPSHAEACRYGGDEFAIVLPDPGGAAAGEWAASIQAAVAALAPVLDGRPFPTGTLSVSVGHANASIDTRVSAAEIFAQLFRRADEAMYANKSLRSQILEALPSCAFRFSTEAAVPELPAMVRTPVSQLLPQT